jgi:Helix-turn-helix domain
MVTLLSEKYGPVNPLADMPGMKITMQMLTRPDFQAELFTISLDSDDRIYFSEIPWPHTLIFVFGYSITLYLSRVLQKEIHDRGGHLFHSSLFSYKIKFQKNRSYFICSIHYSEDFMKHHLEQASQGMRAWWELQSPVFYFSRSRITTREVMDLLSMLLYMEIPNPEVEFLTDELARVLLMDFLNESDPFFQPAWLGSNHFETFYQERDVLVGLSSEATPFSKMLLLAGIQNIPLFRKRLRQLYNMNIREFITEVRMSRAMKMLADPTLSIKEIAVKTGFASAFYFTRVFTNYFGLPPKSFHAKKDL